MAKEGDGWPNREIGGQVRRLVAKEGDGWVSRDMGAWLRRKMVD